MDYKEQQEQEIEALEAIYPEEELSFINNEYPEIELRIDLKSTQDEENHDGTPEFLISLIAELPEKYPDELPKLRLEGVDDLFSEKRIAEVINKLNTVAEETLGMVMIFTIVSALQDEIGALIEDLKNRAEQEAVRREKEEVAKTGKIIDGTPVTKESFAEWKAAFDQERAAMREKKIKEREAQLAGKLTGRQLFLADATLGMSDVALIEDPQNFDIDKSLFDGEDLEGLDDLSSDED
ncbi:unnamed protein product, partial [Mesorhabditis spiculigera]